VELPHAEALHRELKDQGFALLTVTQDPGSEVLKMVDYNGITHPIVSDTDKVYDKYHAYDGKHYLIRSDGTILAAFSKLGISIPILRRELAKYGIQSPAPMKIAAMPKRQPVPGLNVSAVVQKDPVIWSAPTTPANGAVGNSKFSVNVSVTIAPGWYIYALSQKPGGPTPLAMTLPANQPFKLAGPITEPKPEVKFDPGFGMEVHHLKAAGSFVLPVTVLKAPPGKRMMVVEARYQACNSNICLPARTDRIEIPVLFK
jgi:hypothetical protein